MKRETFLYTVVGIAIPIGLQSMLQSSFAMIDQLMVGQLGSTAVAALLYKVESSVQDTTNTLLLTFAILAPVKVANMILGGGIIRSGGKTSYIMIIDMIGTWIVEVPLGLITAFVFHMPIGWVYFILSQEELVRFILTLIIFRQKKWMVSLS